MKDLWGRIIANFRDKGITSYIFLENAKQHELWGQSYCVESMTLLKARVNSWPELAGRGLDLRMGDRSMKVLLMTLKKISGFENIFRRNGSSKVF